MCLFSFYIWKHYLHEWNPLTSYITPLCNLAPLYNCHRINLELKSKGIYLAKYLVFDNYFVKNIYRNLFSYVVFDFLKIKFKVDLDFSEVEFYAI